MSRTAEHNLPLLPLVLADVPDGLARALEQEGVPAEPFSPGSGQGRVVLFDSRARGRPGVEAGQVAVDVHRLRELFRHDPFVALGDEGSTRAAWALGPYRPTEEVARVDKRWVRWRLLAHLRSMVEDAGGIWIRLSSCPWPYQSALNFRIDYDEYHPSDFRAVQDAMAGYEEATSHFVCGASYESARGALARLRGLDVGSHGYHHHTYRTVEENVTNIARGIDVLVRAGLQPSGFAAPHGRFHRNLLKAAETLGIEHSSEFGLAYDEVPFRPAAGGVLEVPVHPVCLGIVQEAARAGKNGSPTDTPAAPARAWVEHVRGFADAQHRLGEPIFLYGHPTGRLGRYPQALAAVLHDTSNLPAVWKTTLAEFARWWRFRIQVRLTVWLEHGSYVVKVERPPGPYRLAIRYYRGQRMAVVPLEAEAVRFSPNALSYVCQPAELPQRPVPLGRPGGLRHQLQRILDWETVTPFDEIPVNSWRNLAKRTLRLLWSTAIHRRLRPVQLSTSRGGDRPPKG